LRRRVWSSSRIWAGRRPILPLHFIDYLSFFVGRPKRWPVIAKQSSGHFSRERLKAMVRHYL
jgi:hypothetical protein